MEEDEEEECPHCFETGEYFTGSKMKTCHCEAGDVIRKSKDGSSSDNDTRETVSGQA